MPGNYSKLVTVITGQTITASERNNEFDNVINNMTPDGVDDASLSTAAMQATADPSGANAATTLRGELQRLRFQLLKLGAASGNWYDALPFLAALTPASAGATATDLNNRLAQLASQLKNGFGLTNWYDAVTAMLPKSGGTMTGALLVNVATNKITLDGTGTTGQLGNNYDLGTIPNASDTSAAISLLCPTTNAQVLVSTSDVANAAPATRATFQSGANGGCQFTGTATNDSAAAGNIGEVIESVIGFTNAPTSGQYGDLTSISLTAGDWSVSVYGTWAINTATVPAGNDSDIGVSTTTGNSSTGLVAGDTVGIDFLVASTRTQVNISIPPKRFSLSATTTVYLKYRSNYSAGVPQCAGRITATRRR